MPYYNLIVVADHRMLATVAVDRERAVAEFGEQLDIRLSLSPDNDSPAPYLMDEWTEGPHWVNPTIPVFEISN